jgi:hypothetical protein
VEGENKVTSTVASGVGVSDNTLSGDTQTLTSHSAVPVSNTKGGMDDPEENIEDDNKYSVEDDSDEDNDDMVAEDEKENDSDGGEGDEASNQSKDKDESFQVSQMLWQICSNNSNNNTNSANFNNNINENVNLPYKTKKLAKVFEKFSTVCNLIVWG